MSITARQEDGRVLLSCPYVTGGTTHVLTPAEARRLADELREAAGGAGAREFHSTVPLTDARPLPVGWWPRDEGENPL